MEESSNRANKSSAHMQSCRERFFPGGVSEHYRLRGPDGPLVVRAARGGCITLDHDGAEYVDFRMGYGLLFSDTEIHE